MEGRPAMRDGTIGYEWHRSILSRCNVHLLRDTEDSSGENDLGSPQYDRHRIILSVYHDASMVCLQVEQMAGGRVWCASQIRIIRRISGLLEFVDTRIGARPDACRRSSSRSRTTASPPPSPTPPPTCSPPSGSPACPPQQRRRVDHPRPVGRRPPEDQVSR